MILVKELRILTKLTKESPKEIVAETIRRIIDNEGEAIYQIVLMTLKERIERGYSKKYSLRELGEKLPWKKSTLIEKTQKTVEEGIMKHEKRKYILNTDYEIVRRLWNYYNDVNFQKKDQIEEIWDLIQKVKDKERIISTVMMDTKKRYKKLSKKEMEKFTEEILDNIKDSYKPLEDIIDFIEKNILKALGYKET